MSNWFHSKSNSALYTNSFEDSVALNANEMIDLMNDMVAPNFFQQFWQKVSDWISSIIVYPFEVLTTSINGKIKVGSVVTNATGAYNVDIDLFRCAEYKYERILNNFGDFSGYTKFYVYLPYNGIVELTPNDCIDKYIQVLLSIDWKTGAGTYIIGVTDESIEGNGYYIVEDNLTNCRIIGTYQCQIGHVIPLGTTNTAEVQRNMIMGLVRAPVNALYGAIAVDFMPAAFQQASATKLLGGYMDSFAETIQNAQIHASFDRPNSMQALRAGSWVVQFIRLTPRFVSVDSNYNRLYGRPLMKNEFLENLSGYTEIGDVHVEGDGFATATKEEVDEIYKLLTSGVILGD